VTWTSIHDAVVKHFKASSRQASIRCLQELPYFFEGWFTAEVLIALRERFPAIRLLSNTNYSGFQKPDIVIEDVEFTAVVALKHIATRNPDAASRWDGRKGSTVSKDILNLRTTGKEDVARRVLVFYGPAVLSAHKPRAACEKNRPFCVECSTQHLSKTLEAAGHPPVAAPVPVALLEPEATFHLLEFEP